RAALQVRAERLDQEAAVAGERAAMLSELHEVRQQWMAAHEADQDAALEAERELKRRGRVLDGPQQEPEQLELFAVVEGLEAPDREAEREGECRVPCAMEGSHLHTERQ